MSVAAKAIAALKSVQQTFKILAKYPLKKLKKHEKLEEIKRLEKLKNLKKLECRLLKGLGTERAQKA